MLNYCKYLNLYGLCFKIGFDNDNDADDDYKIIFGVDYCGSPIFYSYWDNDMSFIGEL